jgi:hypothetical protein
MPRGIIIRTRLRPAAPLLWDFPSRMPGEEKPKMTYTPPSMTTPSFESHTIAIKRKGKRHQGWK